MDMRWMPALGMNRTSSKVMWYPFPRNIQIVPISTVRIREPLIPLIGLRVIA